MSVAISMAEVKVNTELPAKVFKSVALGAQAEA